MRRDDADVQLNVKSTYIGSKIFDAVDVTKAYDDKVILNGFEYTFARYEKVGIVGNNGVGKSTFIKMLLGEAAPDSGHFDIGETVKFGYYSQDGIQFNEQDKVIDAVRRIAEVVVIDEKRATPHRSFCNCFCSAPKPSRTTSTSSAEARSGGCILPPCSCAPPTSSSSTSRPTTSTSRLSAFWKTTSQSSAAA